MVIRVLQNFIEDLIGRSLGRPAPHLASGGRIEQAATLLRDTFKARSPSWQTMDAARVEVLSRWLKAASAVSPSVRLVTS